MKDFQEWCSTATELVRFWPDRDAVRKELEAHYLGHYLDLRRLEYPQELAEQRALTAMGDAQEVGRALDRAHKPWLGWLWMVSRWLVLLCLAAVLWTAVWGDGWISVTGDVRTLREGPDTDDRPMGIYLAEDMWQTFRLLKTASTSESVTRSGCRIGSPSAALWEFHPEDGQTAYYISAVLKVEMPRFWEYWTYGPDLNPMVLTDSTGQDYWTYRAKWDAGIQNVEETEPDYVPTYSWNSRRIGLTRRTYALGTVVRSEQPVEWVELRYPLGEGFVFHLDLREVME